MTEHKYAHILRAIADGNVVQWRDSNGEWNDESENTILREVVNEDYSPERYRVKPDTITINGVEVPEPVRDQLAIGTYYWLVDASADTKTRNYSWSDHGMDFNWIKSGLIHLTKEAAEQHARALILASGGSID